MLKLRTETRDASSGSSTTGHLTAATAPFAVSRAKGRADRARSGSSARPWAEPDFSIAERPALTRSRFPSLEALAERLFELERASQEPFGWKFTRGGPNHHAGPAQERAAPLHAAGGMNT